MRRKLTPRSSLESLKREAKRWLTALRADDPEARARLARALADAPETPALRDVQHALAREHGLPGWTALVHELAHRSTESVPASRTEAIETLLRAAEQGRAERVAQVLDAHPDIVNERAELSGHAGKRSALHFAMIGIHEDVVVVLLARGADPNLRDNGDEAMPLHFAAEKGQLGVVRKLIEHGADPIGDGDLHELEVIGWATCFEYAFHREVAEYLLAHGARHTIFSAVAMGDTTAIREIVAHPLAGTDAKTSGRATARSHPELDRPMDRTNHRRRPLHLAVIKRRPESLATLLELGADPEATDAAGLTPLDQAALSGASEMAQQLVDAGARIGLPAAVALDRQEDLERLMREEPDCLRPGQRWARLIIRAAERAPGRVIETLIRHGASVHVRDEHRTAVDQTHGYTALHAAAFHGNLDAIRVLLRHGANPADREDKYWGSPAGWAAYAGHEGARDLILEGPIDIIDAIHFDCIGQIAGILASDPQALERRLGAYVTGEDRVRPWLDTAWTPLAFAVAHGKIEAVRTLLEHGADTGARDSAGRTPVEIAREKQHDGIVALLESAATTASRRPPGAGGFEERVADFLMMACLDWGVSGSLRDVRAKDAARLLAREPQLARANIYTAVVCGETEHVQALLDARPEAISEIGGPRRWPPILYLCSVRLGSARAVAIAPRERDETGSRHVADSVAMLRLLLDRGADPNAFYLGGNADIHYTVLTCVLGRGEEMASMHPRAREMAALLLEHGADPHDGQVLYNVFADNTSRHLLDDDIIWLLELMYEHSIRRGHEADWKDAAWPMFDMRGAPSLGDEGRRHRGARFMLDAAVDRNMLRMAEWLLEHGAGPNTPPGELWRGHPRRTLYQEALALGHTEMAELLVRYGAERAPLVREGIDAFIEACLAMDQPRVRAMLAEHPGYLTDHRPMFAAIEKDREDAVGMLLDLGVSPDVEDVRHGRTRPLHMAAAGNAERSATLLIERGADVDAVETNFDAAPIGWASYFGNSRMIELLGAYSRNVWTLAFRGLVDRLRAVLRETPALARVTNSDGQTPLFWLPSDEASALEIAALLLEGGADPLTRDTRGTTAAEVAERRGLARVAELLRSAGR